MLGRKTDCLQSTHGGSGIAVHRHVERFQLAQPPFLDGAAYEHEHERLCRMRALQPRKHPSHGVEIGVRNGKQNAEQHVDARVVEDGTKHSGMRLSAPIDNAIHTSAGFLTGCQSGM